MQTDTLVIKTNLFLFDTACESKNELNSGQECCKHFDAHHKLRTMDLLFEGPYSSICDKSQSYLVLNSCGNATGILISGALPGPPVSTNATRMFGS